MSQLAVIATVLLNLTSCQASQASELPTDYGAYASLYDDSTLRYWQRRYEPNVRHNFQTVVLRNLRAEERASARGLELDVPLRDREDPLAFYAVPSEASITISTLSLKFLDDAAIASTWLVANDFSVETLAYYADVLKYRRADEFRGGCYPPLLSTLGVPADALADDFVDRASQNVLKSAVVFILAHEVGHVRHRHADAPPAERQRQELEADRFAMEIFRRAGTPPGGVFLALFLSTYLGSHRADFETDEAWTEHLLTTASHPVSGTRLRALAAELRRRPADFVRTEPSPAGAQRGLEEIARNIEGIAPLLDDPLLQHHARVVGRRIPLSELRPRRPGSSWVPPR